MGKPMLKDLQNNVSNIVVIHALAHADARKRNTLRAAMAKSAYGVADLVELLGIFDDLGSVEFATSLSRKHAALARSKLNSLPNGEPKRTLEAITGWLEGRRK